MADFARGNDLGSELGFVRIPPAAARRAALFACGRAENAAEALRVLDVLFDLRDVPIRPTYGWSVHKDKPLDVGRLRMLVDA